MLFLAADAGSRLNSDDNLYIKRENRAYLPLATAYTSLRVVPDKQSGLSKVRFWHDDKLVGIQMVRNEDLNIPNF